MSYLLLEKLARTKLPQEVSGEEMHLVRAYLAAGLVEAHMPPDEAPRSRQAPAPTACVLNITSAGRKTLEQKKVRLGISRFLGRGK